MPQNYSAIGDSELNDLVAARLSTLPAGKMISVGSEGEFTKEELMAHIKKNDEIGKKMVEVELQYLQSIKNIAKDFLTANDE